MKQYVLLSLLILSLSVMAQERPKMVIGIVVDQMTSDYLNRFSGDFSDNGFNRLTNEGHSFPNTFFNYITTATGPGHASIYTGSTPSIHGIVGNVFYDYSKKQTMYCVSDLNSRGLGKSLNAGRRSPKNLETSSITDMFVLSLKPQAKVIGIGMKDRSSILPAGHMADYAFWWDDSSSEWTSSNYYTEKLPQWLNDFHKEHPMNKYLTKWNSSIDKTEEEIKEYAFHDQFESPLALNASTSLPYDLEKLSILKGNLLLKYTPLGNTYTFNFAKKAIKSESMGVDEVCDFLCISLSSTDYIGHNFGPYSEEIRDTYIKLDKDIADFLNFLDAQVGQNNYLIFLTSDHGVVPNVSFLASKKMPTKRYNIAELKTSLDSSLKEAFNIQGLILSIMDNQVYFDLSKIKDAGLDVDKLSRHVANELNSNTDILLALSSHDLMYKNYTEFPAKEMKANYYKDRSGQVLFSFKNYMRSDEYAKGTGHGTVFNYDRNVPLIFFGKNILPGISYENVEITQIASTLADLLKIQRPPSCVSESLAGKILK